MSSAKTINALLEVEVLCGGGRKSVRFLRKRQEVLCRSCASVTQLDFVTLPPRYLARPRLPRRRNCGWSRNGERLNARESSSSKQQGKEGRRLTLGELSHVVLLSATGGLLGGLEEGVKAFCDVLASVGEVDVLRRTLGGGGGLLSGGLSGGGEGPTGEEAEGREGRVEG
jgi:hypothetical protein